MITVHILFVIAVAIVCYWVGIFTHALLNRMENAGDLLIDEESGKVVFKFALMPDELAKTPAIRMRVVKSKIRSSDSDEIN